MKMQNKINLRGHLKKTNSNQKNKDQTWKMKILNEEEIEKEFKFYKLFKII
jgi:hypothetical protein